MARLIPYKSTGPKKHDERSGKRPDITNDRQRAKKKMHGCRWIFYATYIHVYTQKYAHIYGTHTYIEDPEEKSTCTITT